jgi:hypothetical protein
VEGSGIARRGFVSRAKRTGRFEAAGDGDESDGIGAVLALVVGDLARPWTKQRRRRGPTGAPNNERDEQMETVELSSTQQSLRIAELPEDY